ncbi:hypothetical protein KAI65_02720 [Candidatus Parcubacteria bacterium]|nr:hypothetical protein [Candidatus Parcubacteria bacterium]
MTQNNIGKKILDIIEEKKIIPRPKWQFLLKAVLTWISGIISLIIGALAFSVIIYMLKNNDWDAYMYINDSLLQFILLTLPYFWILFLIMFIFIFHYNFRHTKKGYKYRLYVVAVLSIFLSMLIGSVLYASGVGKSIDFVLSDRLPAYTKFINRRQKIWMAADEGRLGGIIINIKSEKEFELEDLEGKAWHIMCVGADIHPRAKIEVNNKIRIIGEEILKADLDMGAFKAELILPAEHLGHGFRRNGNGGRCGIME